MFTCIHAVSAQLCLYTFTFIIHQTNTIPKSNIYKKCPCYNNAWKLSLLTYKHEPTRLKKGASEKSSYEKCYTINNSSGSEYGNISDEDKLIIGLEKRENFQ